MTPVGLMIAAALCLQDSTPPAGAIRGIVVNVSRNETPVAGAEVALRVRIDGSFVVAGETVSDAAGRFAFEDIPADPAWIYLPGASWESIHYPGARLQLSADHRETDVVLRVRDVVRDPNPLVVRQHRIVLESGSEFTRVTEFLTIENPTTETFVGQPGGRSDRAETLRLSIPSDFRRVTFHSEFFGQRFVMIDGHLVTDVPWTPGERELAMTYTVPTGELGGFWQRSLDLPSFDVAVRLERSGFDLNQPLTAETLPDPERTGDLVFTAERLSAGENIEIPLADAPIPWLSYLRWVAPAALLAAIVLSLRRQRKRRVIQRNPRSPRPRHGSRVRSAQH